MSGSDQGFLEDFEEVAFPSCERHWKLCLGGALVTGGGVGLGLALQLPALTILSANAMLSAYVGVQGARYLQSKAPIGARKQFFWGSAFSWGAELLSLTIAGGVYGRLDLVAGAVGSFLEAALAAASVSALPDAALSEEDDSEEEFLNQEEGAAP